MFSAFDLGSFFRWIFLPLRLSAHNRQLDIMQLIEYGVRHRIHRINWCLFALISPGQKMSSAVVEFAIGSALGTNYLVYTSYDNDMLQSHPPRNAYLSKVIQSATLGKMAPLEYKENLFVHSWLNAVRITKITYCTVSQVALNRLSFSW